MSTTKANTWLCILFSTLSGISFTLSSVLPAYYAHKEKKVEEINDHEEKQEGEIYSHQEAKGEGEGEESIVSLESFLVNHTTKQDEERHESFNDDINDESKNNEKISACMWKVVSIGSMVLQILGVVFAYFALVFGAISTYSIVFTASYLFSGMILMSYILGIEKKPNKDTRVGNYFIVVAAVLVVVNGPITDQEISGAEIMSRFSDVQSTIFLSICGILLLMTFPHHLVVMFSKKGADTFSDNVNFIMFQMSIGILGVFNTISLKMLPLSNGWIFGLNLAMFIFVTVWFPFVSIVQNVVIKNPGVFLSISSGVSYLLNVVSGLLVFKDKIHNSTGYGCSIVTFLLGIYLITETDIVKVIGQKFEKLKPIDHRNSLVKSMISLNGRKSILEETTKLLLSFSHNIRNIKTMDALPPNDPNRNNNNQNSHVSRKAKEDPRGPRNARANGRNEQGDMEMFGGGNVGDEMMVAAIIFCGLASWLLREVCLC